MFSLSKQVQNRQIDVYRGDTGGSLFERKAPLSSKVRATFPTAFERCKFHVTAGEGTFDCSSHGWTEDAAEILHDVCVFVRQPAWAEIQYAFPRRYEQLQITEHSGEGGTK